MISFCLDSKLTMGKKAAHVFLKRNYLIIFTIRYTVVDKFKLLSLDQRYVHILVLVLFCYGIYIYIYSMLRINK